jgi:propionyl-CoA carboxylase alpha chain
LIPNYSLSRILSTLAACMFEITSNRKIQSVLTNSSELDDETLNKVAIIGNNEIQLNFYRTDEKMFVFNESSNKKVSVVIDWLPGNTMVQATIDEVEIKSKVKIERGAFFFNFRGYKARVHIQRPREAALSKLMIERPPDDVSKLVICPMPGLLVDLAVVIGDYIESGQDLCTIEAMKMENVLKAEKNGVVRFINKNIGDSLGVDDVIMEFD